MLAVFATMYVRDHCRPAFHEAIGVTPTDYDFQVFRLCSEISRQVFPLTLDLDNPKFAQGLERLYRSPGRARRPTRGRRRSARSRKRDCRSPRPATFTRLYFLPSKPNALPAEIRLAPVW